MHKFFGHLKTILIHKWYVFVFCCKCGIPFRGIVHDLSKFSPTEFWESVRYYTGKSSPINACKKDKGYSLAWQHHKGHNSHHYQHWTDNYDSGKLSAICMPLTDTLEMLCDYLGASKAYSRGKATYVDELSWWISERNKSKSMHPVQIEFLDTVFVYLAEGGKFPKKKYLKKLYFDIKEKYPVKVEVKK